MQIASQILRYQQGSRSKHPAPDATIASSQSGTLTQQGEQLAVLVDLNPLLPYRSREIRTLAVKTYWSSTGSTVARLRRALAAANRYLVHLNEEANASAKCTGSITCAVFSQNELFLGQIGAAHVYVSHGHNPDLPFGKHQFEVFPERNRLMIALGNALPPAIHISFTQLEAGSTVFMASTPVAESQARETWQQAMSLPVLDDVAETINKTIASNHSSGTVIVCRISADAPQDGSMGQGRRNRRNAKSPMQTKTSTVDFATTAPDPAQSNNAHVRVTPVPARLEPMDGASAHSRLAEERSDSPQSHAHTPVTTPIQREHRTTTRDGLSVDADTGEILEQAPDAPRRTRPKTDLSLIKVWFKTLFTEMKNSAVQPERPKLTEKQQLRLALRALLPTTESATTNKPVRKPPQEQPLLPIIVSVIAVLVVLITVFMNTRLGGSERIADMETALSATLDTAYNSQSKVNWEKVKREAADILAIDETNLLAGRIYQEAQNALDALESAAILDASQLYELPATAGTRKILLADNQLFVLDTTTDEVFSFQLTEDLMGLTTNLARPILHRGQSIDGVSPGDLIDFAWVQKEYRYTGNYGALYILGTGGVLFIYEPSVGTSDSVSTIDVQYLDGEFAPGSVTAMDTYGTKILLTYAYGPRNEILTYSPLTGDVYDLPQKYFSEDTERNMNLAFDIAVDERIYVLMADGEVIAYHNGIKDHNFIYSGVNNQSFSAQVIALDQDPDPDTHSYNIYLGDPQSQRIAIFNRSGRLLHLFRTNQNQLAQLESMSVYESKNVLYFIAANRLYVAPLPAFVHK